jgi:hypothetical protein
MATTTKRTTRPGTRPLTPKQRELGAALHAAEAKGESLTPILYKAMSPEAKRVFVERHST